MRIEIVMAESGLDAHIKLPGFDLGAWKQEYPDVQALKRTLQRLGALSEALDDDALAGLHGLLCGSDGANPANVADNVRRAEAMVIARGLEPRSEEVEALLFHRPYLSDPGELESLRARLLTESFEDLAKSPPPGDVLVDKGEEILSYKSLVSGKPGKDVFGGSVPLQARHRAMPVAGSSLLESGRRWLALRKGFLVLDDNVLRIWAPRQAGTDFIWVSEDRMSARLILRKFEEDDPAPTLKAITTLLDKRNFAHSPPEAKIRKALEDFLGGAGDQEIDLLKGTPARPGRDGSLEMSVDPEPSLPDAESVGSIDFKNFTFFRTVKKGEVLAKILPPEPGSMGMDVYGEPILAPEVFPFSRKIGKNTEVPSEGPGRITALCDGKLAVADGVPEVVETLKIGGDVSLKTGNVNFPGSVEVNGDLRDNLEIHASGAVDITGVVEDGCIVSEGAVVVKGGFTGTGKGVIKSKLSSVTIGYIRNQRIESHSNIVVYNEVVNAHLFARKSIIMKTSEHSVVGGHLLAYQSIEIHNAGSPAGIKTILEVGKDFEVERMLQEKRAALKVMESDRVFLEKMLAKLQDMVRWGRDVKPETRLLEQRTKGVMQFLAGRIEETGKEILDLDSRLYHPGDCFIHVRGEAHPGTTLRHRDKVVFIKDVEKGKRWVFRK